MDIYSKIMNNKMLCSFSKVKAHFFYSGLDGYMSFSILASIRSLGSGNQRGKKIKVKALLFSAYFIIVE